MNNSLLKTFEAEKTFEEMTPEEIRAYWFKSVRSLLRGDDSAARSHLAAGRPITIGSDEYPGKIIRKWPSGRQEILELDDECNVIGSQVIVQNEPVFAVISVAGEYSYKAVLSKGKVLMADDLMMLAGMLVRSPVHVEDVNCGDWRVPGALGAGQSITLKNEMKRLVMLLPYEAGKEWHQKMVYADIEHRQWSDTVKVKTDEENSPDRTS